MKRLLCRMGFHRWGAWASRRHNATGVEIYRHRRCKICGKVETEMKLVTFNLHY